MTPPYYTSIVANDMLRAANEPNWNEGSAEPWVTDILAALVRGNATRNAIEVGGFQGYTSARLYAALQPLPWRTTLTVCEIDPDRADLVRAAIAGPAKALVNNASVVVANSLDWIPTLPAESIDFVWLDGNHEKQHVMFELHALLTKMAPGGLICGHDVFGSCDLQQVFAMVASQVGWCSMSLDLPALGPAGGIGIIQRPR